MSEAINWKALTPEQRNQIVAEKIFDGKTEPCVGKFVSADYVGSGRQLCISCGAKYTYPGPMVHNSLPPLHYSTDIGAAWMIVGKMRNNYDGSWLITIQPHDLKPNEVTIFVGSNSYSCKHAFMAEAICIAALRAVGCEVKV